MINKINVFGIMRSGIHVIISWIINKLENNSTVYYNNIRNIDSLKDRLILKTDTRILPIKNKLHEDINTAKNVVYSFESKNFDITNELNCKNILIIRNPYNLLASSYKYIQNEGPCKDIIADIRLIELWKYYAKEFLSETNYIPNKVTIVYDLFITNKKYRKNKCLQLKLNINPDDILTLDMGGGSSFGNNNDYHNRYKDFEDTEIMKICKNDNELSLLWNKIVQNEIEKYNILLL
jgi:hypothetical protein